jgi:hypothetical protein
MSMACWQRLEITVRIGYMHNAAHPQSLPRLAPPCRAKRRSSFQVVPVCTWQYCHGPTPCPPTLWASHRPRCPASIHRPRLSTKPGGAAGPAGDSPVHASVGRACQRTVGTWESCNPPAPPCPISCSSPSVPLPVHALSALLLLGACFLSPVPSQVVFSNHPKARTPLYTAGPVSRSSLFAHCPRTGLVCTAVLHPPSSDLDREPRQCGVQVHACCVIPAARLAPQPHAWYLDRPMHTITSTDRASGKNLMRVLSFERQLQTTAA